MPATKTNTMTLHIGRRHFPVDSIAAASAKYSEVRDASGKGASSMPDGRLVDGAHAYRISYNGKVWTGEALAYNPYA